MESSNKQRPPFEPSLPIETLENGEFNTNAGRIHSLGDNFVIRRFPIEGHGASTPEAQVAREERIDTEKRADQFFSELKNYDINVVPYRRVVGPDLESPSQEAIYTITDRIDGKPLNELTPEEIRTYATQIDETFAGIFSYLEKVATEGGIFHSELYAMQFMAGTNTRHPDQGKKIFLVDIDPLCFEYNPKNSDNGEVLFFSRTVLAPIRDIESLAKKSGCDFLKSYDAATKTVKALALGHEGNEKLQSTLQGMKRGGSAIIAKAFQQST